MKYVTGVEKFEQFINAREEGGATNMYDPFMEELKNEGMDAFAKLTKELLDSGRTKDLSRATVDKEYRDQLMKELAIQ